jgi:5-amino-6-(D-ribitylamino)uracil---L-tyrosine 4-hydroxyphenyl transferase
MNFNTIANKVLGGREIGPDEGLYLFRSENQEEILDLAHELNAAVNGCKVTYVRNRNFNFTNICMLHCRFCGFCREEGHPQAFFLGADYLLQKIREAPGITEVCIQGAIHPRLAIAHYLDLLRRVKERYPRIHIHGISPQEVFSLAGKAGWTIAKTIAALMEAGLGSMAGTAAEILVDRVRRKICPGKISSTQWVEIVKTAHRLGLKSTATLLFGHIETPEDIVEHLTTLREVQRETEGFTEFVPLLFIPFSTPLGSEYSLSAAPWSLIRKVYALSRIYLSPAFRNIQTSWVKLGVERALDTLDLGANDFGGTLFEENITRSAGGSFGEFLSVGQIRRSLVSKGKSPLERDTLYGAV